MKVYQYVYCMSLVSQHYTFHWNWKCLSCAACDSAKLPLVTSMIVYLVGSVSDWPRWRTQTQTLSYHFFFSLLGSVSVFQFGLGEDLRLKLPAFGGKSNCSLQKHCMSWLPFVGVFAAITGFGGETLTWQLWY